ncbi:unnamed protein product [Pneumocystis jirovecii]|uniref:Uncharacterized protein n=1 Tax=Pneumocystis jirovecii TaxID=42068 RepID=L0P843_PNEJI|nr:unnamed protein product [Pneumocystis jirovecii]
MLKPTRDLAKKLLDDLENKRQVILREISRITINKDFDTACDSILKDLREDGLNETSINLFLKEAKMMKITSERDFLSKERLNLQNSLEKTYPICKNSSIISF